MSGLDDRPSGTSAGVLISVLIPLEFHRDQAAAAIRKWRAEQTLDASRFELILVASDATDPRELQEIRLLLEPHDRLLQIPEAHDMAQVSAAARHATGDLLFFTESHVWPTPGVLAACLETFELHPEWAGFSCRTRGHAPNRLAEAEARMYESDIEYGMTIHPWRKILDQCFATRRAPYQATGGFDPTLRHFAEWVLAARYHALGFQIGYVGEIELIHHYIGHWRIVREFTADFVAGEKAWFSRTSQPLLDTMFVPPAEWASRGDRQRDLARRLLEIAFRHTVSGGAPVLSRGAWREILRAHVATALAGAALPRITARLGEWRAWLALMWTHAFGTDEQLDRAFQQAIAAVAHEERLRSAPDEARGSTNEILWTPEPALAGRSCGFYGREEFGGVPFRWSREVAVIDLGINPGWHEFRLETLLQVLTTPERDPAFFLNGRRIAPHNIHVDGGAFLLRVKCPAGRPAMLGWISGRQPSSGDRRRLGLPVTMLLRLPRKCTASRKADADRASDGTQTRSGRVPSKSSRGLWGPCKAV